MRVAFRADASHRMGTGHVMRCLALADRLASQGARCLFVCRSIPDALHGKVIARGHGLTRLRGGSPPHVSRKGDPPHADWLGASWEDDAEATTEALVAAGRIDWLVTDHYAIDRRWHTALRRGAARIMAIDDLADRPHDCDLLLDQNDLMDNGERYLSLVPADCTLLLGPRHALLRSEFAEARSRPQPSRKAVPNLLVFFGGSDPDNHTAAAIAALDELNVAVSAEIVIGAAHASQGAIEAACRARPRLRFHCQIDTMADLMMRAGLAIGAGGSASWERACLGLPAIVIALADNQVPIAQNLARRGVIRYLGFGALDPFRLANAITEMLADPAALAAMGTAGQTLVDGLGVERVVRVMEERSAR